jgi:hypothetical protein
MTVTTRTTHIIGCDDSGCTNSVKSNYNLDTAKATALRRGWQVSYHPERDGGLDHCPLHRQGEEVQHGDDSADGVRDAL